MHSLTRAALALALAATPVLASAQEPAVSSRRAIGTFDVKLTPRPTDAAPLGRLAIEKTFEGDLAGTSRGEMLSFRSTVDGSAGYVAMEQVTGMLHGRSGAFVLQHSGTMDRGAQHLALTVVPDSGTGELEGLAGSMQISVDGGAHRYEFEYTLAPSP